MTVPPVAGGVVVGGVVVGRVVGGVGEVGDAEGEGEGGAEADVGGEVGATVVGAVVGADVGGRVVEADADAVGRGRGLCRPRSANAVAGPSDGVTCRTACGRWWKVPAFATPAAPAPRTPSAAVAITMTLVRLREGRR